VPAPRRARRHASQPLRFVLLVLVVAANYAHVAAAHDFWLQPRAYWCEREAALPVTLLVGHGPARQRSPISPDRIVRFEAITSGGSRIDLRSDLHLGSGESDALLRLRGPGTYILVLQTDARAHSDLPAIRFNDYLSVEGLTPALELRARTHRTDVDGSENYSRQAKSIVQVGALTRESQAQVTMPLGLPLEIVPELSPYAEPRPATLPVRVLYGGRPLPGALVKLTNLEHDASPVETHPTDLAGRAIFTMPSEGSWLLNVIWTKPQPRSRDTDFETTFSSLTFGLPKQSSQR
jgi:uncharacterized GH25 family protein